MSRASRGPPSPGQAGPGAGGPALARKGARPITPAKPPADWRTAGWSWTCQTMQNKLIAASRSAGVGKVFIKVFRSTIRRPGGPDDRKDFINISDDRLGLMIRNIF